MRTNNETRPPLRSLRTLLALASIVALFGGPLATPAQSAIPYRVLGSGGTKAASTNYRVRGTLGQPVIGTSTNASRKLLHGYWYNPYGNVSDAGRSSLPPSTFALGQNHPNPFNPTTRIEFKLPQAAHVRLQLFDARGAEVSRPIDRSMEAGPWSVELDATGLGSGIYFYRLEAGGYQQTRKLTIVK